MVEVGDGIGVGWVVAVGRAANVASIAAGMLGDVDRPGIKAIVGKLRSDGDLSPEAFVDSSLDLVGPLELK